MSSVDEVPGWFPRLDQRLFDWFLRRRAQDGDLLELGVYLGKSAVVIGRHVLAGQRFTVCDLFESAAPDAANDAEMRSSYATLTRSAFEANYLAFHQRLPTVIEGPTSVILEHVQTGTCRFVHVDASHLYEHVRADVIAAQNVLVPDGVVVLDDYRSEHTPGVAAAVWEAVFGSGLRPICLSPRKFYGTWGDPVPVQDELRDWLTGRPEFRSEEQLIAGAPAIRIKRVAPNHPPGRRFRRVVRTIRQRITT